MGVGLIAICHEQAGANEFAQFLEGKVYVNRTREFFGPKLRWMSLTALVKPSVIYSMFTSWRYGNAASANMSGEGRLLGGLYVVGPGEQGVVYQFEEPQPGVFAPKEDILKAAESIKSK